MSRSRKAACQRTLKAPIGCSGIGLHSGSKVSITLNPAPPGHGIVFASSNHATGMYPVGEPLTEDYPPRPDGLYGASKVWGEALGRM